MDHLSTSIISIFFPCFGDSNSHCTHEVNGRIFKNDYILIFICMIEFIYSINRPFLFFSCPEARIMFANSGGIGYLSRHLRTGSKGSKRPAGSGGSATVQQMYELCFCLWTLTYECNSSATIRATFLRDHAVHSLVDLVSSAPREKVVRVALSALRTLAQCTAEDSPDTTGKKDVTGSTFLSEMIGCGLIKYVDQMKERQWTDPDIVEGT